MRTIRQLQTEGAYVQSGSSNSNYSWVPKLLLWLMELRVQVGSLHVRRLWTATSHPTSRRCSRSQEGRLRLDDRKFYTVRVVRHWRSCGCTHPRRYSSPSCMGPWTAWSGSGSQPMTGGWNRMEFQSKSLYGMILSYLCWYPQMYLVVSAGTCHQHVGSKQSSKSRGNWWTQ